MFEVLLDSRNHHIFLSMFFFIFRTFHIFSKLLSKQINHCLEFELCKPRNIAMLVFKDEKLLCEVETLYVIAGNYLI